MAAVIHLGKNIPAAEVIPDKYKRFMNMVALRRTVRCSAHLIIKKGNREVGAGNLIIHKCQRTEGTSL